MTRRPVGVAFFAIVLAAAFPPDARGERAISRVDSALVLYLDREIREDGGNILTTIKQALTPDALGAMKLRILDPTGQALATFGSRFPNLTCFGAWPGSPASADEEGAQSAPFFQPLYDRVDTAGEGALCDRNPQSLPERRFGFPVFASRPGLFGFAMGEWSKVAMNDVAPRPGELGVLTVTVCPRVRQFRMVAFAGAQLRRQADVLVERIQRMLPKIDTAQSRSPAELVVRGPTTLLVGGSVEDLEQVSDADYNILEIFVRSTPGANADPGSACLEGDDGRVPALPVQSVKVMWNSGAFAIPDAPEYDGAANDDEDAATTVSSAVETGQQVPGGLGTTSNSVDGDEQDASDDAASGVASNAGDGQTAPDDEDQQSALNDRGSDQQTDDSSPGPKLAEPAGPAQLRVQLRDALAAAVDAAEGNAGEADAARAGGQVVFVVEGFESVDSGATANTAESTVLSKERAAALAKFLRDAGYTVLAEDGFGFTDRFGPDWPEMASVAAIPLGEATAPNRAAVATAILLPPVASAGAHAAVDTREVTKVATALSLERAATPTGKCVSTDGIEDRKASIEKYLEYFLGEDYKPFADIAEHEHALIMLCAASGPNGESFDPGAVAPHILRSLRATSPDFAQAGSGVRAGFLHEIQGPRGPRYYLFGHSVLTHFQRGATAGDVRRFCEEFPGLKLTNAIRSKDICARRGDGYAMPDAAAVDDTLFHAVLPGAMKDQVACAPRLEMETVGEPPNQQTIYGAAAGQANCDPDDVLRDPAKLFEALSGSDHVYRAALDVAFDFSRGSAGRR